VKLTVASGPPHIPVHASARAYCSVCNRPCPIERVLPVFIAHPAFRGPAVLVSVPASEYARGPQRALARCLEKERGKKGGGASPPAEAHNPGLAAGKGRAPP